MTEQVKCRVELTLAGTAYTVDVEAEAEVFWQQRGDTPGYRFHGDVDVVLVNGALPVRPHCWHSTAVQAALRDAVRRHLDAAPNTWELIDTRI